MDTKIIFKPILYCIQKKKNRFQPIFYHTKMKIAKAILKYFTAFPNKKKKTNNNNEKET